MYNQKEGIFMDKKASGPVRYSVITQKNSREIVMLRGSGCAWRRCRFCDYHLDSSKDIAANFRLNKQVLEDVTGQFHRLEVINSGSFTDLDEQTVRAVEETCRQKQITQIHFECHWMHRNVTAGFHRRFLDQGILVKLKTGVETFDPLFRECYLDKGIDTDSAEEIARYFDEVCLLQGLAGQTKESMDRDIQTGLAFFERVCVNIMNENSRPVRPDPRVIQIFETELYPKYREHPRVDILLHNTDFGVGGDGCYAK